MFAFPCRLLKAIQYLICLFFFLFLLKSCEKTTSPLLSGQVRLTAEEVGVTEAWLGVQTEHIAGEFSLNLWRDDSCIFQSVLNRADTTVYDSTLLPAHGYRYRARVERSGHPVLESAPLEITTMDTTSHDFSWEITEFPSPYGSGVLRDVAIVNENDIWAVGEIYSDSAQPWLAYNAVHWNGQKWELKRIQFLYFCNQPETFPAPAKSIIAFDKNNIFISSGSQITHWNGQSEDNIECIPVSVNKLWVIDRNNIYAVGALGKIAHYDGAQWQRIESGTDLPIQDIWGAWNSETGEWEILCVASRLDQNEGSELLKINNQTVEKLPTEGLSWSLKAVWFIPGVIYYIGGDGLYPSRNLTDRWHRIPSPFLYKHAIRGQAVNDVIVAGSFGLLSHFNGVSWRHYNGGHFPSASAAYRGVAIHNNIIAVVGYYNLRNGFVVLGRRK